MRSFRKLWSSCVRRAELCALIVLAAGFCGRDAEAQELREQPVPFSVWLDFEALSRANPPKVSLPIWLESVQTEHAAGVNGAPDQTFLRLRLRRVGLLNREVQLRLFFEDRPGYAPSVSAWTETGTARFQSGPLGSGLGLPSSESVLVPVQEADYLEIAVPGDGKTIRGAYLGTIHTVESRMSLDLGVAAPFAEPFGNPAPAANADHDSYLFGRVRATLEAHALKLSYDAPGEWEFDLDRVPLVAVISFEVLNVDLTYPLELELNGRSFGPIDPQLPDLADPGYRSEVRPAEADLRFHYTGWLRCQKVVPGSALRADSNTLRLGIGRQTAPVAVRAVEIELKYNSRNLDYNTP